MNNTCPKCGETKNFHYNYDYTKQHRPVIDILCNECGNFFNEEIDLKREVTYSVSLRKKIVEDLEDLTNKLRNNVDLINGVKQDTNFLVDVSDSIDEILKSW